ncbi:MAG: MerR family transcriptional regulator, copper efflux regulator [Solirubrobacteraceae bacterium]|nr:MerR family transcriptional regulator, copper efflux regulator [Solirubrobacteraceae bacterium]
MKDGLTIHEAAETTGWSPRMLRYLETVGLIEPSRTSKGYRLFGPEQLQRLRTLKELLERHDCGLSDVAFAKRLREDRDLRAQVDGWFDAPATRPHGVPAGDWLGWEQEKHQRLLALAEVA